MMKYIETKIPGLRIIDPEVFTDARGYFMEVYKKESFERHIAPVNFIQDNESESSYGVFRGLHYQEGDTAQAKLVRVTGGKVWDIAVDIRKNSPAFGKYYAVELSAENKRQFFIPRGFAHGFLVLSETAVFSYKVDNHYSPSTERTLNCFDPDIAVRFPIDKSLLKLSEKDARGKSLKEVYQESLNF